MKLTEAVGCSGASVVFRGREYHVTKVHPNAQPGRCGYRLELTLASNPSVKTAAYSRFVDLAERPIASQSCEKMRIDGLLRDIEREFNKLVEQRVLLNAQRNQINSQITAIDERIADFKRLLRPLSSTDTPTPVAAPITTEVTEPPAVNGNRFRGIQLRECARILLTERKQQDPSNPALSVDELASKANAAGYKGRHATTSLSRTRQSLCSMFFLDQQRRRSLFERVGRGEYAIK